MSSCDDYICKNEDKQQVYVGGVPQIANANRLPV
jgi:hypothetical protein